MLPLRHQYPKTEASDLVRVRPIGGHKVNSDQHWCKWCDLSFFVKLDEKVSGDIFLVCPGCKSGHYRHFYNGIAIHCDITKRHTDPSYVGGYY